MLLQIPDVLTAEQVAQARQILDGADWVDGRVTAGHQSARAKDNLQLPEGSPAARELGADGARRACSATRCSSPPRCRSRSSRRCSTATRAASRSAPTSTTPIRQVPGTPHRIRTDLSATLFFTGPDEYDGGELMVEDTYGVHSVKLPAGHLVLYPSTSLHHVRPVTRGARVCSFFWIQSMVRDDGERTLLFDLDTAIQQVSRDLPDHAVGRAADRRLPQPAAALGGDVNVDEEPAPDQGRAHHLDVEAGPQLPGCLLAGPGAARAAHSSRSWEHGSGCGSSSIGREKVSLMLKKS